MAGRDELTPLLLSCLADPSRQEMGALLLALLLPSLHKEGSVPNPWGLGSHAATLLALTAPCGAELSVLPLERGQAAH